MIIVIRNDISEAQFAHILDKVRECGFTPHISRGVKRTIVGLIGEQAERFREVFESIEGVDHISEIENPFKLASREFKEEGTVVEVAGVPIGGRRVVLIAGPCAVESREQVLEAARAVREAGAHLFRAGVYKPRTSPYSFQGLGTEGLRLLEEVRRETGLGIVTEVMRIEQIGPVSEVADMLQVGARNVQNFDLLKELGRAGRPVLLKRGMSTTVKELLMSAEYIMSQGNYQVVLCERGIRTFEDSTRNTLDLNAIPVVKHWSHLPILVDPSHGVGVRAYIRDMSRAGIAAGADGLLVEVHPNPEEARSDGPQSLFPDQFRQLVGDIRAIAAVVGRTL